MSATPDEGWGVIRPGDRKAHYYRQGMSLCHRVGFYGGRSTPRTSQARTTTRNAGSCSTVSTPKLRRLEVRHEAMHEMRRDQAAGRFPFRRQRNRTHGGSVPRV